MDKTTDKPIYQEIATSRDGRDITQGFISPNQLLLPDDAVLQLRGAGDYSFYRDVLSDDQVKSCLQQRRDAIIEREITVDAGGKKRADKSAADFIEQIKIDNVTEKMHYGVFYGYSVAEKLFAREGSRVFLDAVKVRDRRRFAFDGEQRLRLLTLAQPDGELLPEGKFWTFSTGADHDDAPYGVGLAHWLYWPVYFKKNGMKAWLTFLDKFAIPTVVGKYDTSADKTAQAKLLQACEDIQRDSAAVIPKEMLAEILEAKRNGTADYVELFDRMQGIIAKVILSQTMTTDDGSSRSQAEVHENVAKKVVKSDADLIFDSFNMQVVRQLCDWNFPDAAYPRVWRVMEDEEDTSTRAERDTKLYSMGFKPTLAEVKKVYGEGYEPVTPPPPDADNKSVDVADTQDKTSFAEDEDDDLTPYLQALEADMADAWAHMLEPVRRLVQNAVSFEEIQEGLFKLYPAMDTRAFTLMMQQAMTAMELKGRADVNDGR